MVQVMDNKQVTAEWIAQQRQISEIVNMTYEDAPGSVVPLLKRLEKSQTAALDALESSMRREAEKDATIARLTAERDAASASERAYQTPIYVLQPKWDNSKCPRCGESFYPDYETCDDGYYNRPYGLERCPYCGQKLTWDAPTGAESDPIKDVNMKGISIHNCGDVKSQKIISIKTMDDNIDL